MSGVAWIAIAGIFAFVILTGASIQHQIDRIEGKLNMLLDFDLMEERDDV